MLNFTIDKEFCTECGQCAKICPARIIEMADGTPTIPAEKEEGCYDCQHCLAICPTGALSIRGLKPGESQTVQEQAVDADQMELLIKSRRSVRYYQPVDLEPEVIERLLEVASNAPTARNLRPLLFTVVDKREKLAEIRSEVMTALGRLARTTGFPEGREYFANFVELWEEKQVDVLFRNAPHMVVVSTPPDAIAPYIAYIDSTIALSYFELFAQTLGVGTLWCGLVRWAIDMVPEIKTLLGIPADHVVAYVMLFGMPAVHYARTVQRGPANVNVVR